MRWNMTVCSEGLQLRAGDDVCDRPSPNCLQEHDCELGKFEKQRKLNQTRLGYCKAYHYSHYLEKKIAGEIVPKTQDQTKIWSQSYRRYLSENQALTTYCFVF